MTKTQIYFTKADLAALHAEARRSGKSVAELVREAVRAKWVRPGAKGPIGLWDGEVRASAQDHDSVYDEP